MAENHIAHECALTPEAATDEPASSFNRASSPLHDFVEGPGVDPSPAQSQPQPLQQGLEGSTLARRPTLRSLRHPNLYQSDFKELLPPQVH